MPLSFTNPPRGLWLIPTLGMLCWSGLGLAQGSLYRWVDESGAVHYTDSVPADKTNQGHTRLSEQGMRTEAVPPAPTETELQRVREQERLQKEEERRAAAQRQADAQLLARYRTAEEIELTLNGKLAGVDALIQVKRDLIRVHQAKRLKLETQRQDVVRSKKPLTPQLEPEIAQTDAQIRATYAAIIAMEYQKDGIRQEFGDILKRYLELRRLPAPARPMGTQTLAELRNLVSCTSVAECNRYWEGAMAYVRSHSDIKTEIVGAGLLIAFQQNEKEDRTLTLSWTQQAADRPVHLYLDLQCKNKQTASLNCMDDSAKEILSGFRAAVTGH